MDEFLDKYVFPYTEKYIGIGRAKKTKDGLIVYSEREEKLNMFSHIVGIFIGLGMLIISIFFHHTELGMSGGIIFGISLMILYLSSSIYHGTSIKNVAEKKVFRIMDHCSIFVLVAGTCTPFILSMIDRKAVDMEWCFYAFIWMLALAGITLLCINMKRYKSIAVVMYVLMGIILVARADMLLSIIGENGIWMLLLGGLFYLVGLLFYGLGSKREWMHFVFHMLCLAGSIIHCICVSGYVI